MFYIAGTGSALPEKVVTNDDLAKFLDTSDEWIYTRTGIRSRHVITHERLNDLAIASAREALADAALTGADIAVYNGARVRAEIDAGEITVRDVITSFPYANYAVTKVLTGQQVVHMLELGLQSLPAANPSFLQVGGMTVVYDSSAPSGERVVSVTLRDGSPIDADTEYTVVSNEYVMGGGAVFGFLADIPEAGTFGLVSEALYDRFAEIGTVTWDTDGRLADLAENL